MSEYLIVIVLGLIAVGAVAFPLMVGRERYRDESELDADVNRYREALHHGTVCGRCRQANASDSRFCSECGHALG